MRYYFAGRYSRHPELRQYRAELQVIPGAVVTSRWLDLHGGMLTESIVGEQLNSDPGAAWPYAQHDIEDLLNSDAIVSFTGEESTTGRPSKGGRHVEHGFALALWQLRHIAGYAERFRIVIVGPRENVFHTHPATEQFDTWADFLTHEVIALGECSLAEHHPSLAKEA